LEDVGHGGIEMAGVEEVKDMTGMEVMTEVETMTEMEVMTGTKNDVRKDM
jgi:hypothetical protein